MTSHGPLEELVPAILVCRDLFVSKTSQMWSKLRLPPTGMVVVILWFTLCLVTSILHAEKHIKYRETTPSVSPILVTTLAFGLGVQIHPSVYGTLSTVVDNIPEMATAGCVFSAGISAIIFFTFGLGKIKASERRVKRTAHYEQTTLRRDFWRAWRRSKYWCCSSVAKTSTTLEVGKETHSISCSTQLAHFLWVRPIARTKSFDCVGGRRVHWRGLTQQHFGLVGSVAVACCFLAKQMLTHSLVTFPVLMFVCIQSFVAADRLVRRGHADRTEEPEVVHGFIGVLVDVLCGIVWIPLANSAQGVYMVQTNVEGSLVLTSLSMTLAVSGFMMRYASIYTPERSRHQNGRFLLALGWTSFAFGTLSLHALLFYAVFFCFNWLSLEEDAPRAVNNFLFSLLAKSVTGLRAQQARMAGKNKQEAKSAGYSEEEISKAGIIAFAYDGMESPSTSASTGPATPAQISQPTGQQPVAESKSTAEGVAGSGDNEATALNTPDQTPPLPNVD